VTEWPLWLAVGLYGAWQAAKVYRTWRRERALTEEVRQRLRSEREALTGVSDESAVIARTSEKPSLVTMKPVE
jgi:hypothetical protein